MFLQRQREFGPTCQHSVSHPTCTHTPHTRARARTLTHSLTNAHTHIPAPAPAQLTSLHNLPKPPSPAALSCYQSLDTEATSAWRPPTPTTATPPRQHNPHPFHTHPLQRNQPPNAAALLTPHISSQVENNSHQSNGSTPHHQVG